MPDLNHKISTSPENSPCEIKLACSVQSKGSGGKKKELLKIVEKAMNKEPCPSETACHLARPDRTDDPASRIDKTKPGCINFESCEEEEEKTVERKLESGCLDYEDCQDYLREEKRRMKKLKDDEKQKQKEDVAKAKSEWKDKCSH